MNTEHRTCRAFTLIELVVTIAILAMMISFTSVIFKVSIETHRVAGANSEIMQRLRAITNQLNADFKGLRKDGEIFAIWQVDNQQLWQPDISRRDPNIYERFDRIIFFANGDFHSYHPDANTGNIVRGNLARISYMLARNSYEPDQGKPYLQPPNERMLVRTQHVLTDNPPDNPPFPPTNEAFFDSLVDPVIPEGWHDWRDQGEYDTLSMHEWGRIDWFVKGNILTALTNVRIGNSELLDSEPMVAGGTTVDPTNPNLFHLILSEGVGEFQVQGWHDGLGQWLPSIDPDGDGDYDDTNFWMQGPDADGYVYVSGLFYTPQPSSGTWSPGDGLLAMWGRINSDGEYVVFDDPDDPCDVYIDEEHFNEIPGLGRALRFTFTLYDSRGVFENGRTFSHIVYLND